MARDEAPDMAPTIFKNLLRIHAEIESELNNQEAAKLCWQLVERLRSDHNLTDVAASESGNMLREKSRIAALRLSQHDVDPG